METFTVEITKIEAVAIYALLKNEVLNAKRKGVTQDKIDGLNVLIEKLKV